MISEPHEGWLDYEERLIRMYPHFFGNLARKHPKLRRNDTHLCAYILLGIDVNVIADVTGFQPKSIYSATTSLWHKLGLANADEILPHLHSLTFA